MKRLNRRYGTPKDGWLQFDDWAGRYQVKVLVVGETPKRYRIRALRDMRLAGRNRSLRKDAEALVPQTALTFKPLTLRSADT